ncbi:MAG TPA: hypothetical protein V6C57_12010 [Coleofasciculaceae cyanobacterium]
MFSGYIPWSPLMPIGRQAIAPLSIDICPRLSNRTGYARLCGWRAAIT